jgi:pantoate--beta-alanine ligase
MILIKEPQDLTKMLNNYRNESATIGFVPTMGALHQGHLSLIAASVKENTVTVCSIFVNPTQFNNLKDFEKYPQSIENDIELLANSGCTILFHPLAASIYPDGFTGLNTYDLGSIETVYDGAFRPGHFQGVCNVVERLFRIVEPHQAYFGLKDYQQCMVIQKLLYIMNWAQRLKLHFCTTSRESDGLAMSSRNLRLTKEERALAPLLYKMLCSIKNTITAGDQTGLLLKANSVLNASGFRADYLDFADAETLEPVISWDGKQKIVCLAAAFLNEIRLIDNMKMN